MALVLLIPLSVGCASTLHWVGDTSAIPSCLPDRLPTWDDFKKRSAPGRRGAETAVRFNLTLNPTRIQVLLDPALSWVKDEVVSSLSARRSAQLLRHEQLHFAISCLLVREANHALMTGGDPYAMLRLLNAVATRINVQYDTETNHGLNSEQQARWEEAIQARFRAGPVKKLLASP